MFEFILLAVGIAGFGLGAYWDLRYTEFPDWLPYSIITLALATRGIFSFILNDFSILFNSVLVGLAFLGFGLLLYYFKQWGDGDAWLLGALGFLFPDAGGFLPLGGSSMPFPMTIFFNFFIISLFYLVGYALMLGFRSPRVYSTFKTNLKGNVKTIGVVFFGLLVVSISITFYFWQSFSVLVYDLPGIFFMPLLSVFILSFFQYAKAVEGDLFKKKIPVKKLRMGDVIISDKWRGLTENEVNEFKKKGGEVWIKEGVRFAPVFIICLLITLFYGSLWGTFFPLIS